MVFVSRHVQFPDGNLQRTPSRELTRAHAHIAGDETSIPYNRASTGPVRAAVLERGLAWREQRAGVWRTPLQVLAVVFWKVCTRKAL